MFTFFKLASILTGPDGEKIRSIGIKSGSILIGFSNSLTPSARAFTIPEIDSVEHLTNSGSSKRHVFKTSAENLF